MGEAAGLSVWCEDEAGPYQTKPYPGGSWQPDGHPVQQPHEYSRDGTAKELTPLSSRQWPRQCEGRSADDECHCP